MIAGEPRCAPGEPTVITAKDAAPGSERRVPGPTAGEKGLRLARVDEHCRDHGINTRTDAPQKIPGFPGILGAEYMTVRRAEVDVTGVLWVCRRRAHVAARRPH